VYAPLAFWIGSSWLGVDGFGVIDYAGGLTVHTVAGFTALFLGVCVGKKEVPGSVPVAQRALAAATLIVASYFLNAARGSGALGLLNTQMAAFSGAASYAVLQWLSLFGGKLFGGSATLEGAVKGALVGLAATASGSGMIAPMVRPFLRSISAGWMATLCAARSNAASTAANDCETHLCRPAPPPLL
jgi:ammonium transporter, Amt family